MGFQAEYQGESKDLVSDGDGGCVVNEWEKENRESQTEIEGKLFLLTIIS